MYSSEPLLVDAAVLLTPGGLVRDRTVLLQDGRITAVGSRAELALVDGRRLGTSATLVVPGFINAHQHGNPHGWAALGCADGPLEPWMLEILNAAAVDPYAAARVVAARQLRSGTTTTVHHHTTYATSAEEYDQEIRAWLDGYRDSGLRVVFAPEFKDRGQPVHHEKQFFAALPEDLARRAARLRVRLPGPEALLEVVRSVGRDVADGRYGAASLMLGPAGPVWCSDALFTFIAQAAEDDDFVVTSHILESPYEKVFGPRAYGGRETIPALAALGLVTDRLLISHGCQLTPDDAEILAAAGSSVASNPGSNLRLHNGVAPVKMLLDEGVNVAIGTDSMSLGDRDEILDELRLMQALQRPMGADQEGLKPATLLRILTENGARALRRSDVGAIKVGASADLVLVDLDLITAKGVASDPLSVLVASAHPDDFTAVISQGRIVARGGVLDVPPPEAVRRPQEPEFTALLAELTPYVRDHYQAIALPA
jgi:cytosine/adenosine deaminase-related metal-dependent hydrolase